MTLHDTSMLLKKAGIGSTVGISVVVLIVVLVRVGIGIKNSYYPPTKDPPTQTYGALSPLQFPESIVNNNFTYTIETITGKLPDNLPDRLSVFPITESLPNFLNLDIARKKVASLGFISENGRTALPETQLTNPYYEWNEPAGFKRKMKMNINSFDFEMTSDFLSSVTVTSGKFISDERGAVEIAKNFLSDGGFMPNDLDLKKTTNPDNSGNYFTFPRLYSIQTGPQGNTLVEAVKLSEAQVIRVDFYQKDVEYDMKIGLTEGKKQKTHIKLPIVYPRPPFSIMSFWVASGQNDAMVAQAFFTHKNIDFNSPDATYGIKNVNEAFAQLKDGKAYIARYWGNNNNILITDVYLAYYLTEDTADYLLPIYIFEGKNGFIAYLSALSI